MYIYIFWVFHCFTNDRVTWNVVRDWAWHAAKGHRSVLNTGPQQWGHSLCTWGAHSKFSNAGLTTITIAAYVIFANFLGKPIENYSLEWYFQEEMKVPKYSGSKRFKCEDVMLFFYQAFSTCDTVGSPSERIFLSQYLFTLWKINTN